MWLKQPTNERLQELKVVNTQTFLHGSTCDISLTDITVVAFLTLCAIMSITTVYDGFIQLPSLLII